MSIDGASALGRLCGKRLKDSFRSVSFRERHEKRHVPGGCNLARYFPDAVIAGARAEVVDADDCSRAAMQDDLSEARNPETAVDEIQVGIGTLRRQWMRQFFVGIILCAHEWSFSDYLACSNCGRHRPIGI